MTTVIDIDDVAKLKGMIAVADVGDEIVIENNGKRLGIFIPEIDPVTRRSVSSFAGAKKVPVLGLRSGQGWIVEDFDDALPDTFWLGDEK